MSVAAPELTSETVAVSEWLVRVATAGADDGVTVTTITLGAPAEEEEELFLVAVTVNVDA